MISQQIIFCWKQISDTRCVRKEIVEIDILLKSINGQRKILQSIRIRSRYSVIVNEEPISPSQMVAKQSFRNEPE